MQKVSITSDATLWAELANCRHEIFCSPFLRVASVESKRIYEKLVAKKVKDTPQLMPAGFIFQQDGAPAHTARVTQEWLHANCPEIIEKDQWPPNSPDLNPLDYHVWGPCWKGITNCSRCQRRSPS